MQTIISILILAKPTGQFKIPNREVMVDWAKWITGGVEPDTDILNICTEGPVKIFEERWPAFMQQCLGRKPVTKAGATANLKTSESVYRAYFLGLVHLLRPKGWEVCIEPPRAECYYMNICLISREKGSAALIRLRSSEKMESTVWDARESLNGIITRNYENHEHLLNIHTLRQYVIASHHMASHVEGRYLEPGILGRWEVTADPAMTM